MSDLVPPLPVLADERVWPEFLDAVRTLGDSWTAPSGRRYRLTLEGQRFEVALVVDGLGPPPGGDDVDADLLDLACQVHDAVGDPWSGDAVRQTAAFWGWAQPGE